MLTVDCPSPALKDDWLKLNKAFLTERLAAVGSMLQICMALIYLSRYNYKLIGVTVFLEEVLYYYKLQTRHLCDFVIPSNESTLVNILADYMPVGCMHGVCKFQISSYYEH